MNINDANYWNSKWQQQPVVYKSRIFPGQTDPYSMDVRNFIWSKSIYLEHASKQIANNCKTLDDIATEMCLFVQNTIKYDSDIDSVNVPEYWQFPAETFKRKHGDCEDGAIYMVSLMRNAGIPAHRIKVAAGLVKTGKHAETGGHAYPVYLRDDGEWVILDWCYYPNKLHVKDRKVFRDEENYLDIWFTFNDEYTWSQKTFKIDGRIKK